MLFNRIHGLFNSNITNNFKYINRHMRIAASQLRNVDQTKRHHALNTTLNENQFYDAKGKLAKHVLDTKFENTEIAYRLKKNSELLRGLFVFSMCSVEYFVNNQIMLLNILKKLLGNVLFEKLMRSTFFGHFIAGSDEEEIAKTVKSMRDAGITTSIYYSVEADLSDQHTNLEFDNVKNNSTQDNAVHYYHKSERNADVNLTAVIKSIDVAGALTSPHGISAIKLTSLIRPDLLVKLSDTVNSFKKSSNKLAHQLESPKSIFEFIEDEYIKMDLNEWTKLISQNTYFGKALAHKQNEFTMNELGELRNLIRRLNDIAKRASELNVEILVDAEQTYYQWAITELAIELMKKHNKTKPLFLNTYQNYLKSTHETLKEHIQRSRTENFCFGAKLVRGAYIEQERKRSNDLRYPSPIQDNFEATTKNYETNAAICLNEIKARPNGTVKIVIASHNEDTVRYVVKKLDELDINPNNGAVFFGQLYGMCDFITYNLSAAHYPVIKLTPYGPLNEVLPYITRRANENRGIFDKVKKEKALLVKELRRRFKNGQLISI